ncbi:hypothetical protein BDR06DRAFT_1008608 [Suillus hirtellus]|nr:hypothetical protein BDR06DRAFT_1008608 [Suillus hirtellus]
MSESDESFTIKLELPSQLEVFSFTFKTTKPGPVKVEISIDRRLQLPNIRSFSWTTGATAQCEVVDDSETEPESPVTVKCQKDVKCQAPNYKLAPLQSVSQEDWTLSLSLMSNEPETPLEFTRWYTAYQARQNGSQARQDEAGVQADADQANKLMTPPFKRRHIS